MRNTIRWVMTGVLVSNLAVGCASQTRTVRVEETVRAPAQTTEPSQQKPVTVERETVTETRHEPHGILSTTVHVVGEILALPFRLIGGLLRLLF